MRIFKAVLLTLLLGLSAPLHASQAVSLSIKGAIGPAISDFVVRNIENNQDKTLILLSIDTPGGLDTSTRQIVKAILASRIPVVGYVSPKGARAASAGTFILYACPIAAMAPGTHLGAATPVSLSNAFNGKKEQSSMKKKVTNDAVATIKTLAQLHGRDSNFAIAAVKDAATMTANEALSNRVINFLAADNKELLRQLNGYTVKINNQKIKLNTTSVDIKHIQPDWRSKILAIITAPTVAYLLLMLGIYGIFFELLNPGFVLPGTVGAIAMIIALYALHLLPINYAGLGLMFLGVIFMIAEAFIPSFGALGIGGIVAFLFGSFLLIDSPLTTYQIARSVIFAVALANGLFFITLIRMLIKSKNPMPQNDIHHLIGATGITLSATQTKGQAKINGEIWHVVSDKPLPKQTQVVVTAVNGLILSVKPTQLKHKE